MAFVALFTTILAVAMWGYIIKLTLANREMKHQIQSLKQALDTQAQTPPPAAEIPGQMAADANNGEASGDDTCTPATNDDPKATEGDREMFERIEQEIISRRLYAANLNREQLVKELGIPRAQFASFFRQFAGESFPKYMNRLRLREAVRIMRENPNHTIDSVVAECGMSRQIFYALFREQYGITPSEFRQSQEGS